MSGAGKSALRVDSAHQRTNVGDEPIVPGHQFVELPTRRQILILETRRLPQLRRPEHLGDDLVVDRGEHVAHTRKEATDAGANPCAMCRGARRT